MSEAFNGEVIARAFESLLKDGLNDALTEVQAFWAGIEDIDLGSVPDENYIIGHKPTLINRPSSDFPMIAILVTGRFPIGSRSRSFQRESYRISIDIFNVAADEETVNLKTFRFVEAVVKVVQSVRTIEGYSIVEQKPSVNISEAGRHMKDPEAADMTFEDDEDFAQIGRVTVELND